MQHVLTTCKYEDACIGSILLIVVLFYQWSELKENRQYTG